MNLMDKQQNLMCQCGNHMHYDPNSVRSRGSVKMCKECRKRKAEENYHKHLANGREKTKRLKKNPFYKLLRMHAV